DAIAKGLDVTFKAVVTMGMTVAWVFGRIGQFVTAAAAALDRFRNLDFRGVVSVWKDYAEDVFSSFGDMLRQVGEMWREGDPFELIEASAKRVTSVIRGDIEEIVVTAQRVTSVMGEGIREYEE